MPELSKKIALSFPVSAFPTVTLYRPLKLYGRTFKVHISTGLTLSPDTVIRTVFGLSLLQVIRNCKPLAQGNGNECLEKIIKDLLRAVTKKNKLTSTTKSGVKRVLGRFFPEDALTAVLDGKEHPIPLPWESDWEALLRGLGAPGDDFIYLLVQRLARLDRVAWSARQMPEADIMALLELHIGRPHEDWQKYNPSLNLKVAFLVDVSMQTLVWLERLGECQPAPGCSEPQASLILPFLAEGKKPLGHWLLKIQNAARCANLLELSNLSFRKGIKLHGVDFSHDLLKKWSSGQQLMSMDAAKSVIKVVGDVENAERYLNSFWVARFLSFLCDFLVAGTHGEPPSWKNAQDMLYRRYEEVYEQATKP